MLAQRAPLEGGHSSTDIAPRILFAFSLDNSPYASRADAVLSAGICLGRVITHKSSFALPVAVVRLHSIGLIQTKKKVAVDHANIDSQRGGSFTKFLQFNP